MTEHDFKQKNSYASIDTASLCNKPEISNIIVIVKAQSEAELYDA